MNRSMRIRAFLSVLMLVLAIYSLYPTFQALSISSAERQAAQDDPARLAEIAAIDAKAIRRGLDLKGGMYLVLDVDQTGMNTGQAQDALLRVKEILYNRVDKFGVSEPEITTFGASRIVVKLPGLQDPERAKDLLGRTARLEFRMVRPEAELEEALAKMDQIFQGEAAATEEPAAEPPAEPATEDTPPAPAPADTAAGESLLAEDDLLGELPEPEDMDLAREEYLREFPFSGLVVAQPGLIDPATPLLVAEIYVDRVQKMLDDPRSRVKLREVEFQLGMNPVDVGGGQLMRAMYLVDADAILTGDQLTDANANNDPEQPGYWLVQFNLNSRGARQFAKTTGDNVGRFLAISLDGHISSAPVIRGKIPAGSGVIEGRFAHTEAADLALLLRAGALPTDVFISEERTVGPSLGSDSIRMGISAALYGSMMVVAFMIFYYRMSGIVTVVALVSNILILLGVLAQFGLVLTLPGIAGIILTVGMAVDANVLINERIREELRKHKTIKASVQSGYQNATRTIIDANVTTLIAGGILLWFGTGPIKGFAVTLSIGILSSMFTALVMTRALMDLMTRNKGQEKMSI